MSIIIKNKKEIRKYLKNILKELNYNKILEDSLKCQFKILHSSLYKQSNSICCYISMLNELQTNKLIQYALNDLKKVYIPKIIGSNRYDMELHEITSIEQIQNFPKSKWGIPEPPDDAICSIDYANYIDIVFVPGVAFDNQCKRLGHGKGYYDTFLTLLTQKCHELGRDKPPFVVILFLFLSLFFLHFYYC